MKSVIAAGLLAALALAPIASAEANVIYTFDGAATSGGFNPPVDVQLELTSAGTGFALGGGPSGGSGPASMPTSGNVDRFVRLVINNETVSPTYLRGFLRLVLAFDSVGTVTSTTLDFRGDFTDLILTGTGSSAIGYIGYDTIACQASVRNCGVSGTWTATEVPEPMSITLFGAGLAGLAMIRRRKA